MGIESVSLSGYEDLLLLSSPSTPGDTFQSWGHQENCTREDFNIFLDYPVPQSLSPQDQDKLGTDSDGNNLPKYDDMKYWLVAGVLLIYIRRLIERNIFEPLGKRLGIKDHAFSTIKQIPCRNPNTVGILETAYSSNKKLTNEQLQSLSKETDLKQREIERWMRRRRAFDKPSKLVKFKESGWRFVAYIISTSLGVISLWGKPWFWDVGQCWIGYPNQEVPNAVWWYYLHSSSLYISFLLTQFSDVKRKDFWEMFLHHIVCLGLLSISFVWNLVLIGTITLVLHECADIFVETVKMTIYAKWGNSSAVAFVIFTLVWVVTRLVIFPTKVIYQAIWIKACLENKLPHHIGYPILGMLLILYGLNLFWTYCIGKMAMNLVKAGPQGNKDSRSSSESSDDDDDDSSSDSPGSRE